ncbi:MBL fold metallo-hydrolase [Vibrio sp.]|uniref:MBL fold metallo-hydrolase n=1 Tax=Vibrio sp. TaxID=678 RepID=UPI003D1250F4
MEIAKGVEVIHHGGKHSVTGSCHQLQIGVDAVLVDCGLLQGEEAKLQSMAIDFSLQPIQAVVLTHTHIDHIGRLPWLLAAGFQGPIYCSAATAHLVPLMLDDALKIQQGLDATQRRRVVGQIGKYLRPSPYNRWVPIKGANGRYFTYVRFNPAGHILGSTYLEFQLPKNEIAVFSGDLGPRHTPLLPDPIPPARADYLFLETTYGDQDHENIQNRSERLLEIINRSLADGGAIIIPAFSIGRTQDLLYDLEGLLHQHKLRDKLPIILDSPLAAKVTKAYRRYRKLWGKEALRRVSEKRHPLNFSRCVTIDNYPEHMDLVRRLRSTGEAAIVIAASGMCQGGRVMDYLAQLLPDRRTDVVMVGYQAEGTLGADLERGVSHVYIDSEEIEVKAKIHVMSGYSAHADQHDLLAFVQGIASPIKQLHLIHGEQAAQQGFAELVATVLPETQIIE